MSQNPTTVFLFVLLLAGLLRFAGIEADSLWLDEGYQSMVGAYGKPLPDLTAIPTQAQRFQFPPPGTIAEVLSNFRQVDPLCPPLYALLLNRWMHLFGGADLAVRSLSVFLSLLNLTAVFILARKFFGGKAALFAALVQTVSPFDIHYAQEARMYSLIELNSTLSCGLLLLLLATRQTLTQRLFCAVGYGAATWALINSHYTALFLVLFQGFAAVATVLLSRNLGLAGALLAGWLLTAVMWVPWLPMFLQSAKLRTASFYVARKPTLWWPFFALFVKIPGNWLIFLTGQKVVAYAVPAMITAFGFLSAAFLAMLSQFFEFSSVSRKWRLFFCRCDRRFLRLGPSRFALVFVWLWALIPALALWLIDVVENHRVVEISRYLMATASAVYILAGVGLSFLGRNRKIQLALLAVHIAFVTVNNIYAHVVPQREPWKQMAAAIKQKVPEAELILVAQYYDIVPLDRYLDRPYLKVGIAPQMGQKHISEIIADRKSFALVTAQEGESAAELVAPGWHLVDRVDLHHGLHLRLFKKLATGP